MNNGQEPATKADIEGLREQIRDTETKLLTDIEGTREQVRDTETKLLTAFYDFAKANQRRLFEVEGSDASLKLRVGSIEDRLLEVEKRLNIPPAV